jgi:hypothetical protein
MNPLAAQSLLTNVTSPNVKDKEKNTTLRNCPIAKDLAAMMTTTMHTRAAMVRTTLMLMVMMMVRRNVTTRSVVAVEDVETNPNEKKDDVVAVFQRERDCTIDRIPKFRIEDHRTMARGMNDTMKLTTIDMKIGTLVKDTSMNELDLVGSDRIDSLIHIIPTLIVRRI